MKTIRFLFLIFGLSLLFCFPVFAYDLVDVGVPSDSVFSGSLADIREDLRLWVAENNTPFELSRSQLNTLVYLAENQGATSLDFDYVTVIISSQQFNYNTTFVFLSREPLHLISNYNESNSNTYLDFGSTQEEIIAITLSPNAVPSWQYVSHETIGFGGLGRFGSVYINPNTGVSSVIDSRDLLYANYNIDVVAIAATDGGSLSKGIVKNYEKFSLNDEFDPEQPPTFADIPAPQTLRGTYNPDTGTISLTWTPPFLSYYVMIHGRAQVRYGTSEDVLVSGFTGPGTNNQNHMSSTGSYSGNISYFDIPANYEPYRLQFTVSYYRYVDEIREDGRASVVTLFVEQGTSIVETPNADGTGKETEGFDKDGNAADIDSSGNVVTDGSSGGSIIDNIYNLIKDIIDGIANVPKILSSFFQQVRTMFNELSVVPEMFSAMFSFMPDWVTALIALGVAVCIILRIIGR